jgi:hypothetical protein
MFLPSATSRQGRPALLSKRPQDGAWVADSHVMFVCEYLKPADWPFGLAVEIFVPGVPP